MGAGTKFLLSRAGPPNSTAGGCWGEDKNLGELGQCLLISFHSYRELGLYVDALPPPRPLCNVYNIKLQVFQPALSI